MPPISQRNLIWIELGSAVIGQFMLNSSRTIGIAILGITLAAALVNGWWYLRPIGGNWWWPALLLFLGGSQWQEPRGWFFITWAVIDLGTGLRARAMILRYLQHKAAEEARQQRMAALGYGPATEPEETETPRDE